MGLEYIPPPVPMPVLKCRYCGLKFQPSDKRCDGCGAATK